MSSGRDSQSSQVLFFAVGPGKLQEQAFVSHVVSEGPVVTTRTINHTYRQLPGTSVRYIRPGDVDTQDYAGADTQESKQAGLTVIKKVKEVVTEGGDQDGSKSVRVKFIKSGKGGDGTSIKQKVTYKHQKYPASSAGYVQVDSGDAAIKGIKTKYIQYGKGGEETTSKIERVAYEQPLYLRGSSSKFAKFGSPRRRFGSSERTTSKFERASYDETQYLPGTSVRYVKSGGADSDTVVKQQHMLFQRGSSDPTQQKSVTTIRRVITDGSTSKPVMDSQGRVMKAQVAVEGTSSDPSHSQKSVTTIRRVITEGSTGIPVEGSEGTLIQGKMVVEGVGGVEPAHSKQGVTMVKKIVTEGPAVDGSKGTTTRTVRRSYHQVETLEGLKTEDLSREMERLSHPALPGILISLIINSVSI